MRLELVPLATLVLPGVSSSLSLADATPLERLIQRQFHREPHDAQDVLLESCGACRNLAGSKKPGNKIAEQLGCCQCAPPRT